VNQVICGLTSSFSPFAMAASALAGVGFHRPIEPVAGTLNAVKGGSTVALKFNVYGEGGVEITDPAFFGVDAFQVKQVGCLPGEGEDSDVGLVTTTGGTSLRYDTTAGQFVQSWKTPTNLQGKCLLVKVTGEGLLISARFKMK
jgi:hypothetical protein